MTTDTIKTGAKRRSEDQLVFGLTLIVVGGALLLDRVNVLDLNRHHWPLILIFIGLVKLVDAPRSGEVARSRRPGAWLVFIGFWGLINEFQLFGLYYDTSWPLMIIGFGLMLVWRAFEGPDVKVREDGDEPDGGESGRSTGPASGPREAVAVVREVVERVTRGSGGER